MITLSSMTANATLAAQGPATKATDIRATLAQTMLAQNPGLKLIDAKVARDDARLSTFGKLALALDDFRSLAAGLTGGKLSMIASASGNAVTSKLTAASATAGVHTVDVQQLAQGQTLTTKPIADKDAQLGSGAGSTITVETGSGSTLKKTTVRLEAGDNSLEDIARAMRSAGLDAQVGKDGQGYSLSLNGETGSANTMRISAAGDPVLQAMFSYKPGSEGGMQQTTAAQDARVVVNGKTVTSGTNTLDDAIPGLSLTLQKTGKSDVTVSSDPSAVAANVKNFVNAFNTLNSKLDGLKTGDAKGDTTALKMKAQLNGIFDNASTKQLAEMGITRKNGALVLDEAKLKTVLADAPERVTQLFSDRGGLAERMVGQIDRQIGAGGTLAGEAAGVMRERDKLLEQKTKVVASITRQAGLMAQQYQMAGAGGSLLFGNGNTNRPMSLFDYMA